MPRRDDPLDRSRRRLEGRLEHLEAAPAEYAALASRPTASWRRADVDALLALEARAESAASAVRRCFGAGPLPPHEGALLVRLDQAREAFFTATWMRLTGAPQPPSGPPPCVALLVALPHVTEDPRPIYERLEAPRFSWDGPARLACRLSRAGLIVGERFVPAARFLERGLRFEPGGEARLPDRTFVDGLELPYRDQAAVRVAIELLRDGGAGRPPDPAGWVIGGRDPRGAWVFLAQDGAFVSEAPAPWGGLPVEAVARALDGSPRERVTQTLLAHSTRHIPRDELRAGLQRLSGDRVQLAAREPVVEVALAPGDAERLGALLGR